MAHIDDLTVLNAASVADTDILYVGVPTDGVDPDRKMTYAELRTALGDAIVEYGSNANGEYARFYNGVQICWHSLSVGSTGISTANTLGGYRSAQSNWTFPVAFSAGTPVVTANLNNNAEGAWAVSVSRSSPLTSGAWAIRAQNSGTFSGGTLTLMAIGRWS